MTFKGSLRDKQLLESILRSEMGEQILEAVKAPRQVQAETNHYSQ